MPTKLTFEQHTIEAYGKSAFQIKLEVAAAYFNKTEHATRLHANDAWLAAEIFIEEMRNRYEKTNPDRTPVCDVGS
jgi:hypothetical protein